MILLRSFYVHLEECYCLLLYYLYLSQIISFYLMYFFIFTRIFNQIDFSMIFLLLITTNCFKVITFLRNLSNLLCQTIKFLFKVFLKSFLDHRFQFLRIIYYLNYFSILVVQIFKVTTNFDFQMGLNLQCLFILIRFKYYVDQNDEYYISVNHCSC